MLDHIGKPGIRHGMVEPWRSQIRELSELPNVVVQALRRRSPRPTTPHWTKEQVRPYVEHVIDCFGFDRVMYGSDWTVSELTHDYPAMGRDPRRDHGRLQRATSSRNSGAARRSVPIGFS